MVRRAKNLWRHADRIVLPTVMKVLRETALSRLLIKCGLVLGPFLRYNVTNRKFRTFLVVLVVSCPSIAHFCLPGLCRVHALEIRINIAETYTICIKSIAHFCLPWLCRVHAPQIRTTSLKLFLSATKYRSSLFVVVVSCPRAANKNKRR